MRQRIDPATARRLLGALTLAVVGDPKVCLWLRVYGAQAADQGQGKAA